MDARLQYALGAYLHDAGEIELNASLIVEYLHGKREASLGEILEWSFEIFELAETLHNRLSNDIAKTT